MNNFSNEEYLRRINSIRDVINDYGYDGFLLFDPYNIFYMGHYYSPGKRPLAVFIHKTGRTGAYVPLMEYYEVSRLGHIDSVYSYDDCFEGAYNFNSFLKDRIAADFGNVKNVLADSMGAVEYLSLKPMFDKLTLSEEMLNIRMIKSQEEVEVLKKSGMYSDYIVSAGREVIRPGISEINVLKEITAKTIDKMLSDMGNIIYVPEGPASGFVPSGTRTALPHAIPSGKLIEYNDTIILSMGTNVLGYRTECERTFFVGKPDSAKKDAFEVMLKAQELAISLMKPEAVCEDIEHEIISFINRCGYGNCIRHRTGHGKGLEEHEPPYIAAGDKTVLREGMILSSEPGIYIEGYSGFRHSDTVLITRKGSEVITNYPKDLESMTILL